MTPFFKVPALGAPFYADNVLYHAIGAVGPNPWFKAWKFNGWRAESMSWKNGGYIHAGLSSSGPVRIKGRDAERYLQGLVINSLARFPVGTMKHGVALREDGMIAAHGIIERKAADEFHTFASYLGMAAGPCPTTSRSRWATSTSSKSPAPRRCRCSRR